MSRINDLIAELSPDGVEFRTLGDLLAYEQPGKYLVSSTHYHDSFGTPVLTAGQTFILGYTDEAERIYPASKNTPVIIFDDFTTAFRWVDFPFKAKSSAMKMLTPLPDFGGDFKFIYYAMLCIGFTPKDHARHWISKYSKFRIPFPPIEVQSEIVKVLDSFTELEAELEAELKAEVEARRRQYHFHRASLLTFGHLSTNLHARARQANVRWSTLSEVAEIGTGSRNTNEELESGKYPFFVRSQEVRFMNVFEFDETAIVTSGDGVGVGKVFHFVQGKYSLHQRAYRIRIHDPALMPKFVFHFMRNGFYEYILKSAVYSSVTSVRKPMLERYPVPILPFEEQERIVGILDQFDALVDDLSECLPAELKARRQQYKYYRDRLLTFREAA